MDTKTPLECSGFKDVKLKVSEESENVHHVFMKEHSVREICAEKPVGRTLFILGTPPFVTQDAYINAFERFGPVENVFFQPCPSASSPQKETSEFFIDHPEVKGFKVAYVVFKTDAALNSLILSDFEKPLILSSDEKPLLTGLEKFCQDYNKQFVDTERMNAEIDEYMNKYDMEVEEKEKKEKEAMEPDEDGWVKVTRKGRRPGFARKEAVHNKIMKREDKKRSKKQLLNFYRFQIRQNKMDHLVKMREKFEEDKKKIEIMKQSRKFKPL